MYSITNKAVFKVILTTGHLGLSIACKLGGTLLVFDGRLWNLNLIRDHQYIHVWQAAKGRTDGANTERGHRSRVGVFQVNQS